MQSFEQNISYSIWPVYYLGALFIKGRGGMIMYKILIDQICVRVFEIHSTSHSDQALLTRYYVEVLLINFLKTSLIILSALFFRTLPITIISLISFRSIRKYAQGWHANYSIYCTLQCLILFVFLPKIILNTNLKLSKTQLLCFFIFEIILFSKFTSSELSVNKYDKYKIIVNLSLLLIVSIILIDFPLIYQGICIGVFAEGLMVLPITKNIVEGVSFNEIKTNGENENGTTGRKSLE